MKKMLSWLWHRPVWLKGAVVVGCALAAWWWLGRGPASESVTLFTARRGDLEINVLEGGSVEAIASQDFKCEVRGYQGTKILKIVEEGYQVTPDDVKAGKVLVELDSSELRKQLTQQEIQLESTTATLTEARQSYDIQLNQNVSDLNAARQKLKFARMDFEKFMGASVAHELIAQLGLDVPPGDATNAPSSTSSPGASLPAAGERAEINFSQYANADLLGDGEAKQKIRKLEDELQVAKKSITQTFTKIAGTRRLHARGFVSKSELETDEYVLENDKLKLATAETARALFLKYEFQKSAEEFLSKLTEAVNELGRARKAAVSKLAQAEAKVKASEGRYALETRQREDFQTQITKCEIRAQQPGLVVYGGGNSRNYWGGERIREGAIVREQQPILTIPDLSRMAVKVKIHETHIKKVKKGLQARLTADAFPDKTLVGEVTQLGVLPHTQDGWVDPNNKVYLVTVTLTDTVDWLKPGMSAKTVIQVKTLPDVVYVPIQSVTPIAGRQYCFIANGAGRERREVEAGEFNDEFIEIKKGIAPGERVALHAPESAVKDTEAGEEKAPEPTPAKAVADVTPAEGGKL